MKRNKKYTLTAFLLAAMCLLSACSFTDKDKKGTSGAGTTEHVTENRTERTEEKTSEGVLESLGEDLKDGAESLGEDLKNGAESVGEDIKDHMDGETDKTRTPSESAD